MQLIYILFIIFIILIALIIFNLNKFLLVVKKINLEKGIPFECGFNSISKFILPFSIPFL